MSAPRCAGALLAGGASRRMGTDKAELNLGPATLAQRAAATLHELTPTVVQCGGGDLAGLDLERLPDHRPGAGPAAGIETALRRFDVPVVVLAVDLPLVPAALLRATLARVERGAAACAPHWRGRWHPLCGTYAPGALPALARRLDEGAARLQDLLDDIGIALAHETLEGLGDPDELLLNVNTPEDLERARELLHQTTGES